MLPFCPASRGVYGRHARRGRIGTEPRTTSRIARSGHERTGATFELRPLARLRSGCRQSRARAGKDCPRAGATASLARRSPAVRARVCATPAKKPRSRDCTFCKRSNDQAPVTAPTVPGPFSLYRSSSLDERRVAAMFTPSRVVVPWWVTGVGAVPAARIISQIEQDRRSPPQSAHLGIRLKTPAESYARAFRIGRCRV